METPDIPEGYVPLNKTYYITPDVPPPLVLSSWIQRFELEQKKICQINASSQAVNRKRGRPRRRSKNLDFVENSKEREAIATDISANPGIECETYLDENDLTEPVQVMPEPEVLEVDHQEGFDDLEKGEEIEPLEQESTAKSLQPNTCSICEKSFSVSSTLKYHMRMHRLVSYNILSTHFIKLHNTL